MAAVTSSVAVPLLAAVPARAAVVVSVHSSPEHSMAKPATDSITLVAGLGVSDDAHAGVTVQHRSRVAKDPSQPNLRQVHLIAAELHDELSSRGLPVAAGAMGENVCTRGVDLLALPTGTVLRFGAHATVEITGLRNPCRQLNGVHDGLQAAVLDHDESGRLVRRAGVMGIVTVAGVVRPGDAIAVTLPTGAHRDLVPV